MRYMMMFGCALLAACASTLPEPSAEVTQLRFIRYRDSYGNGLIPVARNAGEARSQGWQRWLANHHDGWDHSHNQKLGGTTLWCAQWHNGQTMERICRREQGLIWFGRGILRDETAWHEAEKIWIGR